jgi:uncharacterized cupredoxin-like copper-binding protein
MKPLVALCLLAFAVGACGQPDGPITVRLDEFSVTPSQAEADVGNIEFSIRNVGSVPHTFRILRTNLDEAGLPVKGGVVDVPAKGIDVAADVRTQLKPGGEVSLPWGPEIRTGRYVLICNIAGHYESGMHAPFRVR